MRWGTIGMGGAWVLIGGPMRWGTNEMGDQWDGGPLGLAENGWTNKKGDQWEGEPMSSNNVVGDLWIGAPMRRGPMRWGTNEMGDQWVGGTNEMGDQWNEWCMGANWGINEMGDQWDGGPMRWGTNEMGDQWDGGPMMCTHLNMLGKVTKITAWLVGCLSKDLVIWWKKSHGKSSSWLIKISLFYGTSTFYLAFPYIYK